MTEKTERTVDKPPTTAMAPSREDTPASVDSALPADDDGILPGEEDEKDVHIVRARVSRYNKASKKWDTLGTGLTKLKKHEVSEKVRILARDEALKRVALVSSCYSRYGLLTNDSLLQNKYIFKGLAPIVEKKAVRLNLFDDVETEDGKKKSEIVTYSFRMSTEADAAAFGKAVEQEVAKL
jgi:hypothetical protein